MAQYLKQVLCFVLALSAVYESEGTNYIVSNNAQSSIGGKLFEKYVGTEYAKETLSTATDFVLKLLQQQNNTSATERKNVQTISLIVEKIDGIAYSSNGEIHASANYIERYPGNIKKEMTGILYHQVAHILQWDGNGEAPSGLVEGIADFVRLRGGYAAEQWVSPGHGNDWKQGYDVTARFLDYCNSIKNGFVADLNNKMKTSYNDSYFTDLLEKPVTQLWTDYKTKYGTN
jgi:hypothetical protein